MTTDDAAAWAAATADRLRGELAASSVTQGKLAALIGIDRVTLSKYLNGHRDIPVPVFLDIVRELHLDPGELLADAKRRSSLSALSFDDVDHVEAPNLDDYRLAAMRGVLKADQEPHAE